MGNSIGVGNLQNFNFWVNYSFKMMCYNISVSYSKKSKGREAFELRGIGRM